MSDAVRWVLGEQRARLLRGAKMEEVIFQGSSARKPVNIAEVSLHFDNEDGALPIAYKEVVITRRLSRSGESEYLLNRTPCRLRDIHDLLRGTGLAADVGVVIESRMIDALLSDRPDDRRELFEEAAGVGLYRDRRRTTERRLEETSRRPRAPRRPDQRGGQPGALARAPAQEGGAPHRGDDAPPVGGADARRARDGRVEGRTGAPRRRARCAARSARPRAQQRVRPPRARATRRTRARAAADTGRHGAHARGDAAARVAAAAAARGRGGRGAPPERDRSAAQRAEQERSEGAAFGDRLRGEWDAARAEEAKCEADAA